MLKLQEAECWATRARCDEVEVSAKRCPNLTWHNFMSDRYLQRLDTEHQRISGVGLAGCIAAKDMHLIGIWDQSQGLGPGYLALVSVPFIFTKQCHVTYPV